MRKISVIDLPMHTGYTLARDVYLNNALYLTAGSVITRTMTDLLQKMKNLLHDECVYVDTPETEGLQLDEVIKESVKAESSKKLDRILKNYTTVTSDGEDIKNVVNIIMDKIYTNKEVIHNMDILLSGGVSVTNHCLNTSIIATILAVKAGLPKAIVEDIAIGASLHDIGLIPLFENNPMLGDPEYYYTTQDFAFIKKHSELGFKLLEQNAKGISNNVKKIVLLHHVWERYEDSFSEDYRQYASYPVEFEGHKIDSRFKDLSVSIVQAAGNFDSMINRAKTYKRFMTKSEAIECIHSDAKSKYGNGANLLVKYISPYGIGDRVLLTDERVAVVVEQTQVPTKPKVKILEGEFTGSVVDLRETLTGIATEF